jgi:multidrug resistance efflux pump
MAVDFLGVAPWVVITGCLTFFFQAMHHRREIRKIELENASKIDTSRDDLAIELLSSARAEVITARSEMSGLREEITSLRAMEQHFYHFQQALEHLSAVLFAKNHASRQTAERSARAFLNRMARLREAKGTIANEVQRVESVLVATEKKIRDEGGQT